MAAHVLLLSYFYLHEHSIVIVGKLVNKAAAESI